MAAISFFAECSIGLNAVFDAIEFPTSIADLNAYTQEYRSDEDRSLISDLPA
jgi:hypothetical protein